MKSIKDIRSGTISEPWFDVTYTELEIEDKLLRYVGSNRLCMKRVETLLTKEPTTIFWLDSFNDNEVFYDIGANVGMYTIYSALMSGVKVFAFEPEALNYAELNKNIYVNGLNAMVSALCVAASDSNAIDSLILGGFAQGMSHHDFMENSWSEDKDFRLFKTSKDSRISQGSVGFSIDSLINDFGLPAPNHIKIDVDGWEHKVIRGLKETLMSEELFTVLVEIDHTLPDCLKIIDFLEEGGWCYSVEQLRMGREKIYSVAEIRSMRENGQGTLNYIFYKDDKYTDLFGDLLSTFSPPWA